MKKHTPPNISVNKLGEYIVSKGNRQREILRDRKFGSFKRVYHREAAEAVALCLASGLEDLSPLAKRKKSLEQLKPSKIGALRRVNANIDAIESFDGLLDDIDFFGGTPELGAHSPPRMVRHGVEISVRPEIVLRGTMSKGGKPIIGALKVHFSKSRPLNEESAGYVSAVLQEFCRETLATEEEVYAPYCFVIDVGSKAVYPGVKATAQRLKDVDAECRNIAGLWGTIEEED